MNDQSPQAPQAAQSPPSRLHEESDWRVRGVMMTLAGTLIVVALVALVVATVYRGFVARTAHYATYRIPLESVQSPPPLPGLQSDPPADLAALRERDRKELERYAWIDRAAGRVQIPIDRAMDLEVQRGLPLWRTETNYLMTEGVHSR